MRQLRRAPLFTAAAICAMALGTGAGTAVFSVVDRILFRSLPYPAGERLVSVGMTAPIAPQEFLLGYDYLDWRDHQTTFESMGSWTAVGPCDLSEANPVRLDCGYVDTGLLPTLGIRPLLGRNFTRDEDRRNGPRSAILSYGLWQSRFAGDAKVLGRTVPIDGLPATIIGVLPPEFEMPNLAPADALLTESLDEAEQRSRRNATLLFVIARLKPRVSLESAEQSLAPLFQASMKDVPAGFRKDVALRLRTLRDRQIQDARRASWLLLWAVGAVLLIACANVANLLLARAAARRPELAVRAALGAGRGRLFTQAITESLLLGIFGGAAGVLLAFLLLRFFVAIAPAGIPRLTQATVDPRILLFTVAVSLLAALLFGAAPALESAGAEARMGQRVAGTRRFQLRYLLVAAQVSIAMVLLTGAGLLLRSLWNLENQPLGMRTGGVLTAEITLGRRDYRDQARRNSFFDEFEARLRRIPGASEVAIADTVPPGATNGMMLYAAIDVEGRPRMSNGTGGNVAWRLVSPRYFAALGIPVLRGRGLDESDLVPGHDNLILSQALARRMFPGEDPIGRRIRPGRAGRWWTIVGIAGDVKNSGLAIDSGPEYYQPRQPGLVMGPSAVAVIRTNADAGVFSRAVRAEVAALDSSLPVNIQMLEQRVGKLAARPRFNAFLLTLFAAMGLLLAAIGLYGVVSFLVTQRVREIGVRMALGATPRQIGRLVLRQAGAWTLLGLAAGVAASLFAVRTLEGMLFRVGPRDPWLLGGAAAILMAAALTAAWVPSRRAARVDPIEALRHE